MYDAKRWQFGVPSFRLEPLFRRRVPKLLFLFPVDGCIFFRGIEQMLQLTLVQFIPQKLRLCEIKIGKPMTIAC